MPVKATDILSEFDKKPITTVAAKPVSASAVLADFDKVEKKSTGVDASVSGSLGSNPLAPASFGGSPTPSELPLQKDIKLPFEPYDIGALIAKPTLQNLDPVERKLLNNQLPGLTTTERVDAAVKGIVDQRKNPAVKVTNAKMFIADDLEQNPQLFADMPHPEKFKQQIVDGNQGDESVNIQKYYHQRNDQIDNQIKNLKSQMIVNPAGDITTIHRAPNYDELQAQVDDLTRYKTSLNKYTNVLTAYQATNETPLPADRTPSAMKEYYRRVGLKLQSVNSPILAENKASDIQSGIDATRHPELVDVENYRLESDGLNARQFTLNADFNLGKITKEDFIAQSNEVSAQSKQLFALHPQAKAVAENQAIGQILERNRDIKNAISSAITPSIPNPVALFQNIVAYGFSDEEIRAAAKEMGKSEAEIKTLINNKDDIPGTSFLANIYNKFIVHSGEDLVAPITSLVTKGRLRTDAEVEAERYAKDQKFQFNIGQQFTQPETIINIDQKSDDYLQAVANPAAGQHNFQWGALNQVGDALGTLGQLWLATELTGGLGDFALGGTIGADVVGVARGASSLKEATAFTVAQKQLFGNVAGMMLTGYNENKAAAKNFIGEEQGGENARNLYALTRSMETGLLFGMGFSPQTLINKALGKAENEAAAKTFAEMIPKEGIDALDKGKWSEFLKNNLIVRTGVNGLKENAKATAMMAIDQAVGIGTQAMFNPQSVDAKNLGHDLLSSGIHNFLTFAPISFFGAGVSAIKNPHSEQTRLEQEALYRVGQDPLQYADYVNAQVEAGTMLQADANKRIQLVNSMAKIHQSNDIPAELSRSEKIEFANNLLHEKKMYEDIKNITSKPLIDIKEQQIKDLQNRQEEILKNSTGIEKDANGNPVIKTTENETQKIINPEAEAATGQATEANVTAGENTPSKTSEAVIETAKGIVATKVKEGKLSEVYGVMMEKNPEHFLSYIADQSLGRLADGKIDPLGGNEAQMRKEFSDEVVDIAKEMFPENKASTKPIQEMNSAELRDYSKGLKTDLKNQEIEFFGAEGAKKYREAKMTSASSISSSAEIKQADALIKEMEDSLTPEQHDKFFGINQPSGIYDPAEVANIAQRVSLVEDAQDVSELGASLKIPLLDFARNPEDLGALAVLNAAKNRAVDLGIDPSKLIETSLQRISKDLPDKSDASFLVNEIIKKIIKPNQKASLNIETNATSQTQTEANQTEVLTGQQGAEATAEAPLNSTKEPPQNETGIKNEQTALERQNKGLPEVEVEVRRSFGDVFDKGKKAVDDGKVDPRLLAKEMVKKARPLTPEESVALIYDRMRLANEHKSVMDEIFKTGEKEEVKQVLLREKLAQIEDDMLINDEAARKTGYEQGLGLAARKMMIKEDYSLANQKLRYKVANDGKELPKEVVAKLEERTKALEAANKKLEEYEAEINRLKAEKKVKETTKGTKKVNKTVDEFKADRKKLAESIAEKWKNAGKDNTLTAVPIPYAKQLAAIAPDVARMIKSYAEQGITELSEIIDDIHATLQPSINQLTKKDVTDMLAGVYDTKKPTPVLDRKKLELQANVGKIKNQIDLEKEKIRLSQRSFAEKAGDYFYKWRRFALLSGVKVLGKIGVAAGARSFITSPVESVIGSGLRLIPGLSKVAAQAPREGGGFNPKAEAKALTQWVDKATYQDIREIMTSGKGELDYVYAGKLHPPPEWLDFFGQLHSAIKTLPKRGEFFRSFELRAEHAAKNGKDLTDPNVQMEIGVGAYSDSLRSIFMNDNYITDAYKNMIRAIERSETSGAKVTSSILKFLFPIVKVPTNFVAEETSYIFGGLKAAYALRKGVKSLSPEQSDFVIRALKKQAIGAAFMMIGYANPQAVGGYFTGKRKKDDLASGDLVLFGIHLPHWMSHTPLLEALQVGATLRRTRDVAKKRKDVNVFTGIPTIISGIANQVPFISQPSQIGEASASTSKFSDYINRTAQGVIEPQLIKEIAEWTDVNKEGDVTKRDPETFLEQLKTGIPGLREDVPKKKNPGKY